MQPQGRLTAIDLAKGLAIAFMIWVHALMTFSDEATRKSVVGTVISFLGGAPAAPVFMMAMGISFYYSRNKSLMVSVKHGLKIILLGYALNFFRGVLPLFLVQQFAPSAAARIPAPVADYADALLELDILQFAGLALIVMAVIRHFGVNKYVLLLAAVAIAAVAPMLWGLTTPLPPLNHALDFWWGDRPSTEVCIGNLVSFPFFPWFSFPLVGMFIGATLVKSPLPPHATFKTMALFGAILFVAGVVMIVQNPGYQMNDYYHSRFGAMLMMTGFVLIWLYICSAVVKYVENHWLCQVLFGWSRDITTIYVIQWMVIMWLADAILGFNRLSILPSLGVTLGITVLSHVLNKCVRSCKPLIKPAHHATPYPSHG